MTAFRISACLENLRLSQRFPASTGLARQVSGEFLSLRRNRHPPIVLKERTRLIHITRCRYTRTPFFQLDENLGLAETCACPELAALLLRRCSEPSECRRETTDTPGSPTRFSSRRSRRRGATRGRWHSLRPRALSRLYSGVTKTVQCGSRLTLPGVGGQPRILIIVLVIKRQISDLRPCGSENCGAKSFATALANTDGCTSLV